MITKFELNPLQVKNILSFKENHICIQQNDNAYINIIFNENEKSNELLTIACSDCGVSKDIYDRDHKNNYLSDKIFDKTIFLGAGNYSTLLCDKLHARLDYALSILGGQQQNGGMGSEYSNEEEKESESAILDVLKDMIIALGMTDRALIK